MVNQRLAAAIETIDSLSKGEAIKSVYNRDALRFAMARWQTKLDYHAEKAQEQAFAEDQRGPRAVRP